MELQRILERHQALEKEKQPYLNVFEMIGKFIRLRKTNFNTDANIAEFLTAENVYDATAPNALFTMSASLMGNMWPNGAKSFRLVKPDSLPDTLAIREYFDKISQRVANAMDHPKARLSIALDEYINDLGAFGTCGIAVCENDDKDNPVSYKVWDVKTMVVDEDPNGIIDTIYNKFKLSVRQTVETYGINNVSERVRKLYSDLKFNEQVTILHAIYPRPIKARRKGGKTGKGLPYASLHIDLDSKMIMKESGFKYLPVIVGRFYKVPGERYGRSPAMQALPDIIEINAIRESVLLATEKALQPPLVVLDDGSMGAGEIDTSPNGVTVLNVSGRMGGMDPIKPLYTVGELQAAQAQIEQLIQNITQAFFIDRLLDLNNDTRMTLGEAQIRNRIRGDSLTSIFDRQEIEEFTPLIDTTVKILLDKKLLGVEKGSIDEYAILLSGKEEESSIIKIPPEVAQLIKEGREWYKIQYISPAKRMQQAEELQGIYTVMEITNGIAQVDPSVLDYIKADVLLKRASSLGGGPSEIIQDEDTVRGIREQRAAQQAEMMKQEAMRNESEVARNYAQAMATGGQANAQ